MGSHNPQPPCEAPRRTRSPRTNLVTTIHTPPHIDRTLHHDRTLHDGSTVHLGGTTLTAHKTAGHTPGCTTWTMQVIENGKPLNVVIVCSITALSEYRLIPTPGHPSSYPGIAQDFAHTFTTLEVLPCDIFLSSHGEYFGLLSKVARLPTEGPSVFIDPDGYHRTIAQSSAAFEADLARQQAATLGTSLHKP